MKKIIIIMIAAMLMVVVQAQTCMISSINGRKVVQISVNLDSLSGKTLVTTVNNIKDSMVLKMEISETVDAANPVNAGSAVNMVDAEDVADATNAVDAVDSSYNDSVAQNEINPDDSISENADSLTQDQNLQNEIKSGTIFTTIGLNEVSNLLNCLTTTNGEPYAEYLMKTLTEVDSTKYIPQYKQRKWNWLRHYNTYSTVELAGIFGKDFSNDNESEAEEEKIDAEDYGAEPNKKYNKGGSAKFSQVFIFGHYTEDGKFVANNLNFGWSIGALFAADHQQDYGWSWDLLAKLGLQCGNGITLGADVLAGLGSTPYAIYSTNGVDYRVAYHSSLCFKYGAQAWVSMNYGGNTYTSLFARLVKSVVPDEIHDHPTAKYWQNAYIDFDEGSWQVGFAVGYKFGYNGDVQNKRLQASISTGYNLFGADKDGTLLYELEKFTNISPTLRFSYGLGYEQSFGENKLKSLTFEGGWLVKRKEENKLAYMLKFYAGIGDYMVKKSCLSENKQFEMYDISVRQLCGKVGTQLGLAYSLGCSTFSLSLRGGYHIGVKTEYGGYEYTDDDNLKGFELTPFVGYTLDL